MLKHYDEIDKKFGRARLSSWNSIKNAEIRIHPDFIGISRCYREIFKALEHNSTNVNHAQHLHLWQLKKSSTYYLMYDFHYYFQHQRLPNKNLKIKIRTLPTTTEDLNALQEFSSRKFINTLSSHRYKIERIHPTRLQNLINQFICPTVLYEINQQSLLKPQYKMGFDMLAKLLGFSRNHLNYRLKMLNQSRNIVLNALEAESEVVKRLLDDPNYVVKPEDIWSKK